MWPAIIAAGAQLIGSALSNRGGGGGMPMPDLERAATEEQAKQTFGQSQDALTQQNNFLAALQAQNGIGNQNNIFNQYSQMAQGQGPNPALAQLANTTGQNINQQAALMASQRGAGMNPGLLARQAAMQGGALQQSAAGQAAAMQAEQQLAAMQAMNQISQNQIANQGTATMGANQLAQGLYGRVSDNINARNTALVNGTQQAQQAAGQMAINQQGYNNNQTNNMIGGITKGLTNMKWPFGKNTPKATPDNSAGDFGGATGGIITHQGFVSPLKQESYASGGYIEGQPRSRAGKHYAECYKAGGMVEGKAKVAGDSSANDTVHALLSPDEIVIPRSIVLSKNAPDKAAMFVRAVLAKKGL